MKPDIKRPFVPQNRPVSEAEDGFMLVAVVVMVALVLIALSVAAPVIAKDLRRQKEVESQRRAQQYVRAIRLYYRKFHAYPPSMDALKQSNNIRFLRQEYVDPLTGKSNWRILHLGEQKTTVKGFFGQELGGLATGGLGSAAGMSSGVGTPIGGGTSPLGLALTPSATSDTGTTNTLTTSQTGTSTTTTAAPGAPGTTATSTGGLGSANTTGTAGNTGTTDSTGGGGGAIVGVGSAATGDSIATPNKQTTYETWEFWYDPRIEQLYQKGQTNAGIGSGAPTSQPASSFGNTTPPTSTTPGTTTPGSTTTTTSPTTTAPQ